MESLLSELNKMSMDDTFTLPYIDSFNKLDIDIKKSITNDFINISNKFLKENITDVRLEIDISLICRMNNERYKRMYHFLDTYGYYT